MTIASPLRGYSSKARDAARSPRRAILKWRNNRIRSLEAAKFYFYKRKPDKNDKDAWTRINKAVEGRLQEIIDTNPYFARLDDVFFMLGEVYKRMGDQDKAVENWTKAAEETSDEKLKSEIQKRLDESKSQNKDQKKG